MKKPESNDAGEITVELKKDTVDTLLLYEKWIVVAVRCEKVRFELQGTRSERVFIETTILATGGGKAEASLSLTRFTQGDSLLQPGHTYLVAAYDDQGLSPAYNLVEWIPIAPEDAEKTTSHARQAILENHK